ncbi:hypothetical protein DRQ09_10730, partial [candidate division KSB1 bacterium]
YITFLNKFSIETKRELPVIISKNTNPSVINLLENNCLNENEDLEVRVNSIKALGKIGGKKHLEIMRELSYSKNPHIYNSAYESYIKIRKKLDLEEAYQDVESPAEMIFEKNKIEEMIQEKTFYSVKIFKNSPEIAEIEGTIVKLGPISGLIFYILARNAIFKRPYTIDYIARKLESIDIYISRERIKDRIKDIRKKIRFALGDKIDEYKLVENIRKYGYKINALVKVE